MRWETRQGCGSGGGERSAIGASNRVDKGLYPNTIFPNKEKIETDASPVFSLFLQPLG